MAPGAAEIKVPDHVDATMPDQAKVVGVNVLQSAMYATDVSFRLNKGIVLMPLMLKHYTQIAEGSGRLLTSASGRGVQGSGMSKRRALDGGSKSRKYDRFLMLADLSSETGRCVSRILSDPSSTSDFFNNRYFGQRQEGIGDVLWLEEPQPVQQCLGSTHYVPVVEGERTVFPVSLDIGKTVPSIELSEPEEGETKYFAQHKVTKLKVGAVSAVRASCTGKTCDRQGPSATKDSRCGCIYMTRNSKAVVMSVSLSIPVKATFNKTGVEIIENFRSWRFTNLFVHPDCWVLFKGENRRHQKLLQDAVTNIVNLVNKKGGWTYIGWLRKGKTSDSSDANSGWNFASENTVPHLAYLYPTDFDDVKDDKVKNKDYTDLVLTVEKLYKSENSETVETATATRNLPEEVQAHDE